MFNFVKILVGTASYLSGYERFDSVNCDMNGRLFYFTIFTTKTAFWTEINNCM